FSPANRALSTGSSLISALAGEDETGHDSTRVSSRPSIQIRGASLGRTLLHSSAKVLESRISITSSPDFAAPAFLADFSGAPADRAGGPEPSFPSGFITSTNRPYWTAPPSFITGPSNAWRLLGSRSATRRSSSPNFGKSAHRTPPSAK